MILISLKGAYSYSEFTGSWDFFLLFAPIFDEALEVKYAYHLNPKLSTSCQARNIYH